MRAGLLGALLTLAVLAPRTEAAALSATDVGDALRRQGWTPAAIEWAATIPAEVRPKDISTTVAGHYEPSWAGGPLVVLYYTWDSTIEHEYHHAWDLERVKATEWDVHLDLVTISREVPEAATVLYDGRYDWMHKNHRLIQLLGGYTGRLPEWYAAKWFGYRLRHRLVLPLMGGAR